MKMRLYNFIVRVLVRRHEKLRAKSNQLAERLQHEIELLIAEKPNKARKVSRQLNRVCLMAERHNNMLMNIENTLKAIDGNISRPV